MIDLCLNSHPLRRLRQWPFGGLDGPRSCSSGGSGVDFAKRNTGGTGPAAPGLPAWRPRVGGGDPHREPDGPRLPGPVGYIPGEPVPGEVVAYFADDPRKLYQLRQWLPVFERLDVRHPVLIVTRDVRTYAEVGRVTALRSVLARALPDLVDLYESSDPKLGVYVNNSVRNFHSLIARRMLHVHVNHGESDKALWRATR